MSGLAIEVTTEHQAAHRLPLILFLCHADTDLNCIINASVHSGSKFPRISGTNLSRLAQKQNLEDFVQNKLCDIDILIIRILGKPGNVENLSAIVAQAKKIGVQIICLSGTGEIQPELALLSTTEPALLLEASAYFMAGGSANMANLVKYLCNKLLMTAYEFAPPAPLAQHGIYHPLYDDSFDVEEFLKKNINKTTIGVVFYRAHYLANNLSFIDALVDTFAASDIAVLPVFTSSLKDTNKGERLPLAFKNFYLNGQVAVDCIISLTSFAMGSVNPDGPTMSGWSVELLQELNIPVVQAVISSMSEKAWLESTRGLSNIDTAISVVMPEFDGRICSVPIAFKREEDFDGFSLNICDGNLERIEALASYVAKLAKLKSLANHEKRIAFVLSNSSSKASQVGGAVGLDSAASLLNFLQELKALGYKVGDLPESSDQLMHNLIDCGTYDQTQLTQEQCEKALARIRPDAYQTWFDQIPLTQQQEIVSQWGEAPGTAYLDDGELIITGLRFENVVILIQPPRGYGMDPQTIYHQSDLVPTHHYIAVYRYIQEIFSAHAIVHMGKHGTLEWLPGKSVGLSNQCFPDITLADMPLFYPFIINDPGEGCQAKRRSHAVIIDHLTPPMTTADTYGPLAKLSQLVDEYYQLEIVDPCKLPLLRDQIVALIDEVNFKHDLAAFLESEIAEHHQEQGHTGSDLPNLAQTLDTMNGAEFSHLVQEIDGYLCELGSAQIRSGLHILGSKPEGQDLIDLVISIVRIDSPGVVGLQKSLAALFGLKIADLLKHPGTKLSLLLLNDDFLPRFPTKLVTAGDLLELIEELSQWLIQTLWNCQFRLENVEAIVSDLASLLLTNFALVVEAQELENVSQVLSFICRKLIPDLEATEMEFTNLAGALAGQYVPAGPSGAPTRGMANILPTGRNFYAIDPSTLPSQSAYLVGQSLANDVLKHYKNETGAYPESVSISVWGTSAMRTHGDDVGEILHLLGVKPVWQEENRRVSDLEIISLESLGRPRIDVTVRISGFFRDAFPNLIELIDKAVLLVASLDEPLEKNFVRKHYMQSLQTKLDSGYSLEEAQRQSSLRVFGSKPGSYGAGILALIQEGNWTNIDDFAKTFINWGGYAYGQSVNGIDARDEFSDQLLKVEIAIHNQDNREHDIFDSDDYFQFHGGLLATIKSLSGREAKGYFGDASNPENVKVRSLKAEALRVFRSRVINPKWLESIRQHGYKGALEMSATVDYLFGFDATAGTMEKWMYEDLAATYAINNENNSFIKQSNPWALKAITERLLEAAQRGLWQDPERETIESLEKILLDIDDCLEGRQSNLEALQNAQ